MLLKVSSSSYSAFTACTSDWLIDGRSLVKTKSSNLINSIYFRLRFNNKDSVDTGEKHGNYSVKVQSEKYSTL